MVLYVVPFLMTITGVVSEIIRKKEPRTGWTPLIPYLAGFLGASVVSFLFLVGSSMKQYIPFMASGILPRLAFVAGRIIVMMPVLLILSAFFAFFSLAGGSIKYRMQRQDTQ